MAEAMTAAILSGHRRIAPYGLEGGAPGALGRNHVERAGGTVVELEGTDRIDMIGTVAGFGSLAVNTAYSGAGWYGYGYGSGTVWVNTGAGGALAAGDFLFV